VHWAAGVHAQRPAAVLLGRQPRPVPRQPLVPPGRGPRDDGVLPRRHQPLFGAPLAGHGQRGPRTMVITVFILINASGRLFFDHFFLFEKIF
jgi:hypothetical protein